MRIRVMAYVTTKGTRAIPSNIIGVGLGVKPHPHYFMIWTDWHL